MSDALADVLVIKGGTVVDGTGSPGWTGDVAVAGGRVVEIGENLTGDRQLDASGCVVAPGFIDIHTHYDAQVYWDPAFTPSCYHGVTTVVAGNCGFTIAPTRPADRGLIARTLEKVEDMDVAALTAGIPWDFETFPEYLQSVERRGTVLNWAAYMGHTALRIYVMGDDASKRAARPDEIAAMSALVREAMDAGAAGFATSFAITHLGADGNPIPSRCAEIDEIEALFRAVSESGRGVVGVNGGTNLNFEAAYALQRKTGGAPYTYTALLTFPNGIHLKFSDIHRREWANGSRVYPQVSCRPLSFSMTMVEPFTLNTNPVFAALMPKSREERRAAFADPAWRAQVREAWANKQGVSPRWDTYEVMESSAHPELIGRRLTAVAEEARTEPFDLLLELALAEPDLMLRVKAVLANDDVEGITNLLTQENCVLGLSDAGAHVGQLCDAPLPTDLLGNWVRGRGTLTIEHAVRKLSGEQADLFGFADRGYLRPGAAADVVVFDPATVAPGGLRRVRDFPANAERLTADAPEGIRHVLVNGEVIQRDGTPLEDALLRRPGQLVRPAPRA